MDFSSRLIQYRKQLGLSQEELASRLGVSRQAVSKWETGEALPDLQKALLLSEVLGVSVEQLCGTDTAAELPKPDGSRPSGKRFPARVLFAALICLLLGFLLGSRWLAHTPAAEISPGGLPDTVSVDGIMFGVSDGGLTYRFVPSTVSEGYVYQITFTGSDIGPYTFDAPCVGGVCSGSVDIPENYTYLASVLIKCGKEARSVPIAWELRYSTNTNSAEWLR